VPRLCENSQYWYWRKIISHMHLKTVLILHSITHFLIDSRLNLVCISHLLFSQIVFTKPLPKGDFLIRRVSLAPGVYSFGKSGPV
jgi:hypothetical protein